MKLHRTHKRTLEITIGRADRDPMAYRDQLLALKPVWYDTALPGVADAKPAQSEPIPDGRWPDVGSAALPPSDMQQNDHVLRYWNWRLDRIGTKRNG